MILKENKTATQRKMKEEEIGHHYGSCKDNAKRTFALNDGKI